MNVTIKVNGQDRGADVEPRLILVDFIRNELNLTGTHIGCDTSSCGACTILLNGEPVKSCTMLTVQADGSAVTTVEGIAKGGVLDPIQVGFHDEHGLQCGFCTPGMLLVGSALLDRTPDPTEEEIRWAISGNLCRCTGYMNIVKAIRKAGELRRQATAAPAEQAEAAVGGA
ncbi:MAG TPA: (2Fe-2S)-binding protein [Candidatus Dormibacteraeota bacterium]